MGTGGMVRGTPLVNFELTTIRKKFHGTPIKNWKKGEKMKFLTNVHYNYAKFSIVRIKIMQD